MSGTRSKPSKILNLGRAHRVDSDMVSYSTMMNVRHVPKAAWSGYTITTIFAQVPGLIACTVQTDNPQMAKPNESLHRTRDSSITVWKSCQLTAQNCPAVVSIPADISEWHYCLTCMIDTRDAARPPRGMRRVLWRWRRLRQSMHLHAGTAYCSIMATKGSTLSNHVLSQLLQPSVEECLKMPPLTRARQGMVRHVKKSTCGESEACLAPRPAMGVFKQGLSTHVLAPSPTNSHITMRPLPRSTTLEMRLRWCHQCRT